ESEAKTKFPLTIKYRRAEAVIYGKSDAYPLYRVAYYADGKRHMKSFPTYNGEDGAKPRLNLCGSLVLAGNAISGPPKNIFDVESQQPAATPAKLRGHILNYYLVHCSAGHS